MDVTADASGLDAKAAIEDENCDPFCSRSTRLLFGVEELKNVFQFVVISETALAEPPLAAGLELADAAAEDDAGVLAAVEAEAVEEDEEDEELELLLEQADIAVTSTRPSAGAR